MKVLKRVVWVVLALLLILALVGLFLPSKIRVERSVTIASTADVPFNLVNDLTQWPKWSPWYKMDSLAPYTYAEQTVGEGASFSWTSEHQKVGTGKLTIITSKPNEQLVIELDMEGWKTPIVFEFKTENDQTRVNWYMEKDMGYNVFGRWFGLMMDAMMGADFEQGLNDIKQVSESTPISERVAGFEAVLATIPASSAIYLANDNVSMDQIGKTIGDGFYALDQYAKANKLKVISYPFTVWDSPSKFIVCLPVEQEGAADKKVKFKTLEETKAVVVKYYGAYEKMEPVYLAMDAFLKTKNLKPIAAPREIYVTDPTTVQDTSKWLTEIVFPVSE